MVMSGRKQEIPHIIPLMYEGDKSEFLVTIVGRQPTCFCDAIAMTQRLIRINQEFIDSLKSTTITSMISQQYQRVLLGEPGLLLTT